MQVTGHVMRSRYLFVRKYPDAEFEKFLAQVQPETREVFTHGPLETKWYPIEMLLDIMTVADRVLGAGDKQICTEMGRFSADHTLTGVFRGLFFRFGSVNFVLKRAANAWRSHYDTGQMEVVESESGHVELRLSQLGPEDMHEELCLSIQGWMHRAVELVGSELQSSELLMHHPAEGEVTFKFHWT